MLIGVAHERAVVGLLLVLALGLVQSACGGAKTGCAGAEVVATAVVATVVDGTTGQRICDATVTASLEDAMSSALMPAGIGPTHCDYVTGPQPGVYTITASHDGYVTPAAQTVSVTTGACNVIQPQAVTITMTKQ